MVYVKIFRAARADLLRISSEKSWKINDIVKTFPRCARQFVKNFLEEIANLLKIS